jgi:Leucine-rich repeat (LRR) protein
MIKAQNQRTKGTVAMIAIVASFWGCSKNVQKEPALDSNLAAALAQPGKATSLSFSSTSELDRLPEELWTLTNLRELNLSCPNFEKLPPEIEQLRSLEKLVVDCGNGSGVNISLPEEIGNLKNLNVLRLYGAMDPREVGQAPPARTAFKELPEGLRKLTGLKELDLGRNGLPYVPAQIASLESLEVLDLSFNEIHDLPEFVGNLKRLRELSLSGNHGIRLPTSLSRIRGLKVLAGNNSFDLKAQALLHKRFPEITFDFENEFDDCSSNEPNEGYPDWQKQSCPVPPPAASNRPLSK